MGGDVFFFFLTRPRFHFFFFAHFLFSFFLSISLTSKHKKKKKKTFTGKAHEVTNGALPVDVSVRKRWRLDTRREKDKKKRFPFSHRPFSFFFDSFYLKKTSGITGSAKPILLHRVSSMIQALPRLAHSPRKSLESSRLFFLTFFIVVVVVVPFSIESCRFFRLPRLIIITTFAPFFLVFLLPHLLESTTSFALSQEKKYIYIIGCQTQRVGLLWSREMR